MKLNNCGCNKQSYFSICWENPEPKKPWVFLYAINKAMHELDEGITADTQSRVDEVVSDFEMVETAPGKPGPRPKQLVAVQVYGYEVGRGRTQRVVNPDDVYKLAQLGLTDRDIATWFAMKEDTLRYNFADIMAKGREELKMSLRRAMLKNAFAGNAAVQIFLAKNLLGMSDSPHTTDDAKVLPWQDDE